MHYVVIAISPTYATLSEGDYTKDFTPCSIEYIIVALDDTLNQVGDPDYGYKSKRQAERLVAKLNRRQEL